MPCNRITVTRDGDRFRVECFDNAGKSVRVRRSPLFSTIALRRTWAVEQASQLSNVLKLYWDGEIEEGNHGKES